MTKDSKETNQEKEITIEDIKKAKAKIEAERKLNQKAKNTPSKEDTIRVSNKIREDNLEMKSQEREVKEDKDKMAKKKKGKGKKILITLLLIFVLMLAGVGIFIFSKIGLMEHDKLDKNKLGINDNLLTEVNKHLEEDISAKEMKQIRNVLLLGSDTRNTSNISAGRSDTMIICSINPVKNSIKLISIPRDSYVNIPGRGMDKLNHAYAYGQETLLIKTINQNFNLNISEYATIDFSSLAKIINSMGGIPMEITEGERRFINSLSSETDRLIGTRYKSIPSAGSVVLTGSQAVSYARDRTNGSDFDRQMRQQNVIKAMMSKASTLSFDKVMNLIDTSLRQVKTNVNVMSYTGLLTDFLAERDQYMQNIHQVQIPDQSFGKGQKINGVYYFTFSDAEAQKRFADYIYNK